MQENYKIFKVHYPLRSGKDILNKEDYEVIIVKDTDDECEVIMRSKDTRPDMNAVGVKNI